MSRGPDVHTLLIRWLVANACISGCALEVAASECHRWASATFNGHQHLLTLMGTRSKELRRWIVGLDEADIVIRNHLVADLTVIALRRDTDDAVKLQIEVLTVEER